MVYGPPFGLARELLSGAAFAPWNGTAFVDSTPDGAGVNFGSASGTHSIRTDESLDRWAVTGDITVAWRGSTGNTATGGVTLACMANGANGASSTPWYLGLGYGFAGAFLGRANGGGYRVWSGPSPGSTQYTDYDTSITRSVSQVGGIEIPPLFYENGKNNGTASNQEGGSGTGAASGGPFQVFAGQRGDAGGVGAPAWHSSNLHIVASRGWDADEHALFNANPYSVLEEAPRYYFAGPLSSGVTVALTGVAGTGSVGTLGPQTAVAATGVGGTGAVGAVVPSRSLPITGVAGAGSVGAVGPGASLAASGVSATAAVGSVVQSSSVILTGAEASGLVGDVVTSGGDSAISVGGLSRTRRGARRIYLPEPQATAVFHPNALPEELAAHAVKAWQDDEDDETWFLLA